ncbi:uncharacterized protein C9orf43 homolog isoform X2 [Lepus europaeus]|nr:uncharacterized protein C9orf43 homolog isoform X2 [Lepus europaeus]XP_062063706.1 uncharacterized protein C9orf43 homolog isoform X2 [Lepus europaeus]XP_062063707.1 uncharacterized protein C9orf43 homolog isoform X2 [Lepus europaeus]XP_062063708.1 uncharacterized protein C9orf43 homolog isoform X2 [Lepus europaeus]
MDLPDETQWDETTCNLALCQHPQCWASFRRIERGHPRILGSPCHTPVDPEDKLPMLTVVNISGSCFPAKRLARRPLSASAVTKARALLSRESKFDSKFQDRPQKGLPDDLSSLTERPPKLSVLNLNETEIPSSKDIRNMVVVWIPEEQEKPVSQHEKKKRKKSTVKNKLSLGLPGRQHTRARLRAPAITVPPASPVHLFEQFSSESMPVWAHVDMLPPDLLADLFPDGGRDMPCPELKIQLAMVKKTLPLEKDRPDSALSSKMFLTAHRLTLQRPALRHPEHWKKLQYSLKIEGLRKQQWWQQQQRKGAKKKAKGGAERQNVSRQRSVNIVCDSLCESDGMLQEEGPELSETEPADENNSTAAEAVLEVEAARRETSKRLAGSVAGVSWNPELKLLRIIQATDDEEEQENQASGAQSEESLEAWAADEAEEALSRAEWLAARGSRPSL